MPVTTRSLDFTAKNWIASCGCSSNASSFERFSVRNYAKVSSRGWSSKSCGARKSVFCKRGNTQCRVSSMKTAEEPTVNGIIRFMIKLVHMIS